jgi:hypothetical protein
MDAYENIYKEVPNEKQENRTTEFQESKFLSIHYNRRCSHEK